MTTRRTTSRAGARSDGVALGGGGRCGLEARRGAVAGLRTLLAGYDQTEREACARLAYEASFDDSAEGERLHRYQRALGEVAAADAGGDPRAARPGGSRAWPRIATDRSAISRGWTPMDAHKMEEKGELTRKRRPLDARRIGQVVMAHRFAKNGARRTRRPARPAVSGIG